MKYIETNRNIRNKKIPENHKINKLQIAKVYV